MSWKRLLIPVGLLFWTFIAGSLGYYLLGYYGARTGVIPAPWDWMNCFFMTAISLTTVGYGDYLGISHYPLAQVYTIVLLFAGMGIVLYGVSELTSFFVEGHLLKIIERRRSVKAIAALENHIIVCGMGDTGDGAVTELMALGEPFVVIEEDKERAEKIMEHFPKLLLMAGDALDEDTLRAAGIERARGMIACLADDRDTLVLTITARFLNPSIIIIAKADARNVAPKLKAAGANRVVLPTFTGGLRLTSELIRPHVTTFLDAMLQTDAAYRFGEAKVKSTSSLVGTKLSQAGIREQTGLNVIAVRDEDGIFHYNLTVDRGLNSGDTLIAIGTPEMFRNLERVCS